MTAVGHPNWGQYRTVSCAATRCLVVVQPGKLMCRDHWLSLPLALRISILRTFRHGETASYQTFVNDARNLIDDREFAPLLGSAAR